ncbi:hypothetical protein RR48_02132 [Papilio machaon]|uniref:Uncharacterized protein n=1 Tax=Papilio machaon TaxID=76193 RepID=A0A0N0PC32_PAPMA|nr:hypothetical protein RR48_02132 [Papilio machaon]
MQAVDYCQQEQENENDFSKNEQSWCQVGEEVTRWARFLDNYHSAAVQALRQASDIPEDHGWTELEMSHGEMESAACALSSLVAGGVRSASLLSLLHCLHLDLTPHQSTIAAMLILVWYRGMSVDGSGVKHLTCNLQVLGSNTAMYQCVFRFTYVHLSDVLTMKENIVMLHISEKKFNDIELEMSHGEMESAACALSSLVAGGVRSASLLSLLHCLHLDLTPHQVCNHMISHHTDDLQFVYIYKHI